MQERIQSFEEIKFEVKPIDGCVREIRNYDHLNEMVNLGQNKAINNNGYSLLHEFNQMTKRGLEQFNRWFNAKKGRTLIGGLAGAAIGGLIAYEKLKSNQIEGTDFSDHK